MSVETLRRYYPLPQRPQPVQPVAAPARSSGRNLLSLLDGVIELLPNSTCFTRELVFPLDHAHGRHPLRGLATLSGHQLALISRDPELAHFDVRRTVFLDTETTGLGMGTGTKVFLVGAGYLNGDFFHVRQYFLDAYGDEVPFLSGLGSFLSGFGSIVTFNGKAFDWPLLEHRYIYFRRSLKPPLFNPLHVDLLHPARRLWKARLSSCALSSLESAILRFQRTHEDVHGYEIPSLYFRYQRTRDGRDLTGVFYHNVHDILSLAALAIHIDRVLDDPSVDLVSDPIDLHSLGRAYDRAGEAERAAFAYEEALRRGLEGQHRVECLMSLGALQKRQRWWEAAMTTWDQLVDLGGTSALFGLVEQAKYFEHVERDYVQAEECVRHALTLAELRPVHWFEADTGELERRLARLLNRSQRDRGRKPRRYS
jgi:uncharacterized protein YprB with RNaseH-like and TPR domain